jgi:nicotinamide mononucleotide transporter
MGLQVYYLIISFYGWYWWIKGGDPEKSGNLPISRAPQKLYLILLLVMSALFIGIWLVLSEFTDSPIPGWDSLTTSISIVATWMLARKYLEHWVLWMVANTISVGLYIYKGLLPTVVLFIVYTIMAVAGYLSWKREYRSLSVETIEK